MSNPRRTPGTSERELPDGSLVVLRADGSQAVVLNAVGAVVWLLCDGKHSGAEIAALIGERFGNIDAEQLQRDVDAVVLALQEAQLIEASAEDNKACGPAVSEP